MRVGAVTRASSAGRAGRLQAWAPAGAGGQGVGGRGRVGRREKWLYFSYTPRRAPSPRPEPAPRPESRTTAPSGDPRGEMRRRIVALLQEHPEGLTPAEIRDLLGMDRSLADTCLGMLHYGLVQRVGRGRYVVAERLRHDAP
jgi:hypothetical protein